MLCRFIEVKRFSDRVEFLINPDQIVAMSAVPHNPIAQMPGWEYLEARAAAHTKVTTVEGPYLVLDTIPEILEKIEQTIP